MVTAQQIWFAYQANRNKQGSGGAAGATFSDDAEAAFALYDSLGDGLTEAEKTAMAVYIDAEVVNSNHALKDYEVIMPLSGANSLVDYIGGKVGVLVNDPTHSIDGYDFALTKYMNTNYNPSIDSINSSIADALFGIFFTVADVRATQNGNGALTSDSTLIRDTGVGANLTTFINFNGANSIVADSGIADNDLIVGERTGVIDRATYINGVEAQADVTGTSASIITNADLHVGQANGGDDYDGTLAVVIHGAAIGFNHSGYNTNLRALLTSLGTI